MWFTTTNETWLTPTPSRRERKNLEGGERICSQRGDRASLMGSRVPSLLERVRTQAAPSVTHQECLLADCPSCQDPSSLCTVTRCLLHNQQPWQIHREPGRRATE